MDWLLSLNTILAMEWYGWAVGLVNQGFWFYVIVYQQQLYGLAVLTLVLTWRYSVALMKWRRDAA